MHGNHRIRRLIDRVTALPYQTLFGIWVALAVAFALLYFLLGEFTVAHGPKPIEGEGPVMLFLNSLYYSIITATSTGYGDIVPHGFSRVLASLQSILALFIFAVFVTKLVARRQDIALRQIHKLTFEDAFHNIREGFYIVRQDCDQLIAKASAQHALTEQDWADLTTAYRQAQSFLRRVPDFYDAENRLYTIDVRREELLHEGVHRTLQRIISLLMMLRTKHIDWTADRQSLGELRELVQIVGKITHYWRHHSPHHRMGEFEDLLELNEEIQRKIQESTKRRHP